MTAVNSSMRALGSKANDFSLTNQKGQKFSLENALGKPFLIMFICNHCPYVLHIAEKLAAIGLTCKEKGVLCFAVNSNDTIAYPEDSLENMGKFARKYSLEFPYLFDETQKVAKDFAATCTPDFFLYDKHHQLFYRGQMDSSRPGSKSSVTGEDLLKAVDLVSKGKNPPKHQKPSIGCNIKWK